MSRSVEQLCKELGAPDLTSVEVSRSGNWGGANPSVAAGEPGAAAAPRYVAKHGATELVIEADEYEALVRGGARDA